MSQRIRDGENSTGNSGNEKILTLSSQMQSVLFTDYGMSHEKITNTIVLYNQSNKGSRMSNIIENSLR